MTEQAQQQSRQRSMTQQWGILALFTGLTVLMLYPLSVSPATMVPEPTDPLLNAWRMQWNAQAFLGGPQTIANIFNTNIFYPFPLTLVYSEHFIMMSLQALPFLLLADSHLLGMNLSVLATFALSGYAMYLLLTGWTGRRDVGIIAGLLFAFSPLRFGQINHLELLITQWMPLTLLALHWTLTRPERRYPLLFIIFFDLQALSGFHYALNLTIACVTLSVAYLIFGQIRWRPGLWWAAAISILITLLLNWPIWRMYLHFSDVMGAIRTPGEVRIYSAALTDYLTTIPHNFLYGFTFGRWQAADHQFQALMPFGVIGILLALLAWRGLKQVGVPLKKQAAAQLFFALLLAGTGLLLSFGLNETALGSTLTPLLKKSPYFWLYDNVSLFRGIRVPGRFGVLVLLGLSALTGWGALTFSRRTGHFRPALLGLSALILLESWSMPLVGPEFPAGNQIPPVYHWLSAHTPDDAVILELPHQGTSEFLYEYYSSHHWRKLVNGGTGYTPPIYKELRQWFKNFPDARSIDILQQLGVDHVILHAGAYPPDLWQQLQQNLPRYWSTVEDIQTVGDDLILHLASSHCEPSPADINVTFDAASLDGLPNAVQVNFLNTAPAVFVSDVRRVSHLNFTDGATRNFTEPLVVLPGGSQAVTVPLTENYSMANLVDAQLASQNRTVSPVDSFSPQPSSSDWPRQPLGLNFADGPELVAYRLSAPQPVPCQMLGIALEWIGGQPNDIALVQLTDPFGRVVHESVTHPWPESENTMVDLHWLPLPGSMPPGQYGLRVWVQTAEGQLRRPMTGEGVPIPPDQLPPLPLVIHPPEVITPSAPAVAIFENGIQLLTAGVSQSPVQSGDWLRFNLTWQTALPVETNLTVFTQLLGPEGRVWGQYDNQPGGGWYPFSLWPIGRPMRDGYAFQLQADAPPGEYRLIVGVYDAISGERMSIVSGPGQGQDFIKIGGVTVNP
jgi:hypothetical protein